MRWIALAIILASFPAFIAWLQSNPVNRDRAVFAIGVMLFMGGPLQIDAAIMSWGGWPGTSQGILISPVDTLALALIATRRKSSVPFAIVSILWLIPTAISIIPSQAPMASFFVLVQGIQLIVFATAIAGELVRPTALPRLMQGLSIGLIVQAGFVVQQKLTGVVQATGTFNHQNSLGMLVELSVLPLIGYLLEGGKGKLVYAGAAAGLLAVAGGGSRGTLLFLAIGIAVLVLFSLSRGMNARKGKILAAGVAAAVVVVPLSVATLKERFGDEAMITAETEREAFKEAARMIAADNPLGSGANTYVNVANMGGYSERAGVIWNASSRAAPVHHVFLLTRAETGRLGEWMLYLLMLTCALRGLIAGRRIRAPQLGGATLGAGAAATALILHSHYEYVFAFGNIQRMFWLNVGIVFACLLVERQMRSAAPRKRPAAGNRKAKRRKPTTEDGTVLASGSGSA